MADSTAPAANDAPTTPTTGETQEQRPAVTPATLADSLNPPKPVPPADAGKDSDTDGKDDLAGLSETEYKQIISRLRNENKKERLEAKQNAATEAANKARQDIVTQIAQALGLADTEDKTPSVDDLTRELATSADAVETAKQTARAAQRQLTVYQIATQLGADPVALTDSRSFNEKIDDLDPTDNAAIKAAIEEAVKTNPRFTQPSTGAAFRVEHPGGAKSTEPLSLTDAIGRVVK